MLSPIHALEGIRFFKRSISIRRGGIKRFQGSASEICQEITNRCWNGKYFQTSLGHFCQFWTRDFGWCVPSLIKLGYRKEVILSLDYAMQRFQKSDGVFTTITPSGRPFDFPNYAPDSLAMLVHSLVEAKAEGLVREYRDYLNNEIERFFKHVIDPATGLVRSDKHFSSIKDYAKRSSCCYDNCMAGMLSKDVEVLGLNNPFKKWDYKKLLIDNFWKESHFVDDLSGNDFVTGDANLFPFWCGCVSSMQMFSKCLESIQAAGLDNPLPLRYYHKKIKEQDMLTIEIFAKNYERDTIWMHLGLLFMHIIKALDLDLVRRYIEGYRGVIENLGTFPELLNEDLTPYKSLFYYADEGMLWASIYLDLVKELK